MDHGIGKGEQSFHPPCEQATTISNDDGKSPRPRCPLYSSSCDLRPTRYYSPQLHPPPLANLTPRPSPLHPRHCHLHQRVRCTKCSSKPLGQDRTFLEAETNGNTIRYSHDILRPRRRNNILCAGAKDFCLLSFLLLFRQIQRRPEPKTPSPAKVTPSRPVPSR